ncbi:LuxR family transcriptional regulator [Streptomyces sp. A1277]|uniref:LuxR family transcriptional regulator n=1 Tax=Streptomyces sp. A1277 TaxID=2563103 RepID=UPI0010A27FF0|nr:LuxR C-terminal-related transcriptional regulator [Streptomyces sp. A1277]THA22752.1 LuxR family transcriptional regulator [Streptomyces sp. A1277]
MTAPALPGPSPHGGGPAPYLTDTQTLVLHRFAEGHTCRQIARELGVSEVTVRGYSQRLQGALGAETIAHAVHLAHQLGMLNDLPRSVRRGLSPELVEVLRLVAAGMPDSRIAQVLDRPVYTVSDQVKRLRQRLGARDRSHAAVLGMAAGLVRPQDIDAA